MSDEDIEKMLCAAEQVPAALVRLMKKIYAP